MTKTRLEWVDLARGLALTGVVYHHVLERLVSTSAQANTGIHAADLILDGFRMPTLVMLSGLLSASVREWALKDVLRRRVLPLLLVYAVWSVVGTVAVALTKGADVGAALRECAWMVVRPTGLVWYLFALALYVLVARALAAVPTPALLAAAVAVYLVSMVWLDALHLPHHFEYWYYVGEHWVFFVAAERGAVLYRRLAATATGGRAIVAIGAFWALGALAWKIGVVTNPVVLLALATAGTAMAVLVSSAWAGARLLAWARAIGRHSLGVYAVHVWLGVVIWGLIGGHVPAFPLDAAVVSGAFLVVLLGASFGLTRIIERWAPVPFLKPWWDMSAREPSGERPAAAAPAQ